MFLQRVIIFCCCLVFMFGCNARQPNLSLISAEVERVVSGQTIEIATAENRDFTKVRIIGIDAPDLQQSPWGQAAQQRLTELISTSKRVGLESETTTLDSFNRLLAHVWHNETLVSEQLVKEGCVLANTKYPHKYSQRLVDAQEYARLMGYGIWNPQQPLRQSPQQFRSQHTAR